MRAVNLLPRDEARRRRSAPNRAALVAAGGAALLAMALGAMFLSASGSVADKEEELANVSAQLEAMPKPVEPAADESGTLATEREQRAAALGTALGYRVSWDRVLRRFAMLLPNDVWLTSLSATSPRPVSNVSVAPTSAPGVVAAPSGFTIMGYTYSHDGVARLLSRLAVMPDLTNVQLQSSALAEVASQKVVQFTILANVRTGGASS